MINLVLESQAVTQSGEAWTTETISHLAARYDRILEVRRLEDAKQCSRVEQPVGVLRTLYLRCVQLST
ncbi:hypothetical protein [Paenibacillus medicaginis]|uniref:Uncharacterized protein n=1 Tax=Paenibacillus medicaginis TaxID=1470560 RepID=A0ABV5BW16_9BACL